MSVNGKGKDERKESMEHGKDWKEGRSELKEERQVGRKVGFDGTTGKTFRFICGFEMSLEHFRDLQSLAEIEDLIVNRGADPTICDKEGKNALHHLASKQISLQVSTSNKRAEKIEQVLQPQTKAVQVRPLAHFLVVNCHNGCHM